MFFHIRVLVLYSIPGTPYSGNATCGRGHNTSEGSAVWHWFCHSKDSVKVLNKAAWSKGNSSVTPASGGKKGSVRFFGGGGRSEGVVSRVLSMT